jgi:hypothetical protein
MTNLYLLSRLDRTGYDELISVVVAAMNQIEARIVAMTNAGLEGKETWCDVQSSTCVLIAENTSHVKANSVICRNFHAG